MKFSTFTLVAALTFGGFAASGQTIYPVPQQYAETGVAFDSAGVTYRLSGADNADPQAVSALTKALTISADGSVEIVMGEADDDAVTTYASNIPEQSEGYYLSIEPQRVVIAGRDEAGTFYGVQSFLKLASGTQVPAAVVTDYPVNKVRGVIEGFYGNPWSFEDRVSQFEFYAANKMNIYVYGPKDDVYHRSQCYDLYPDAEASRMAELVKSATDNKVEFVWAMHPGNNIGSDRYEAAITKFQQLYDLGVRRFALFFDDINANSVDAQISYLNYLDDNFVKTHSGVGSLIVCPTEYNISFAGGWSTTSEYLPKMGSGLHSDIEIMWTGAGVVDMNLKSSCEWFTERSSRKPFIWLNYPVSDYGGQPLLMGPYEAAATDIDQVTTAFCSNPMQYAEASKVALFSIADFAWNPAAYDRATSWEQAITELMPDHSAAFRTFCLNNIYYTQSTHGFVHPDPETPAFKALIEADSNISASNSADLSEFFNSQVSAATELLAAADGNRLLTEIKEWIQALDLQGKRGLKIIELYEALNSDTPAEFIDLYREYTALAAEADALISRDYEGSLRSVRPTTGMQYVEPWLTSTVTDLIDEFKSLGIEYPDGLFPALILESGNYFILYNGNYLTNREGSSNPTLLRNRDEFTPNTQVWTIKYDGENGRYSIHSLQDNRYVNELGNFGTNPYENNWHTYEITLLDGLYAIRNGGSAGRTFWTVQSSRLQQGSNSSWNLENFKFQLVPVDSVITDAPEGFSEGVYTIRNSEGNLLTRMLNSETPEFRAPSDKIRSTQKWNLTVDTSTNRLKISQGSSFYVNELGKVRSNDSYLAGWNTYELYSKDGRYAILNAGDADSNFWYINEDGLISNRAGSLAEEFNFILEPFEEEDGIIEISAPDRAENGGVYDLQGRRVSNPVKGNIYIINGQKVLVK